MTAWITPTNSTIVRTYQETSMKTSHRVPENAPRVIALALGGWALFVALAGASGALAKLSPALFAVLVALGAVFAVATYYLDRGVRATVDTIDLRTLTLFNLWRIPAGIAFLAYGAAGLLPEAFARNAGWGELLVGTAALAFVFRRVGGGAYAALHLAGLVDLFAAAATAATLLGTPLMANVAQFPLVLIPAFGVAVTAVAHVAALDRLVRAAISRTPAKTLALRPADRLSGGRGLR
jgi:hypothetical protein